MQAITILLAKNLCYEFLYCFDYVYISFLKFSQIRVFWRIPNFPTLTIIFPKTSSFDVLDSVFYTLKFFQKRVFWTPKGKPIPSSPTFRCVLYIFNYEVSCTLFFLTLHVLSLPYSNSSFYPVYLLTIKYSIFSIDFVENEFFWHFCLHIPIVEISHNLT